MFDPRDLDGQVATERPVTDGELLADLDDIWASQAQLAGREAAVLGELDRRGVIGNSAATVVRRTRMGSHTARTRVAAARHLRDLPGWLDALAVGEVTPDHVRHLTRVADRSAERLRQVLDHAGDLLAAARSHSADEFCGFMDRFELDQDREGGIDDTERRKANATVTRRRGDDGMRLTEASLDPESHQTVWDEIRRLARAYRGDGTPTGNRHARALVEMARRSAGADPHAAHRTRPAAGVLMTLADLLGLAELLGRPAPFQLEGEQPKLFDGTPITPAQARQIACDADLIPIVLGGDGQPLDVGRRSRLATFDQRMALRAQFDTCIVEGCHVPFDECEIHHLWPYEFGGTTDLDWLRPVCPHDHGLIHLGKLALAFTETGAITYLPIGVAHATWATPERAGWIPPTHPILELGAPRTTGPPATGPPVAGPAP